MKFNKLLLLSLLLLTCGEAPEEPNQIWAPSGFVKVESEWVGGALCQVFDFYETWDENATPTINNIVINIPTLGVDQATHLYNAFYQGVNALLLSYDVLSAAFEWPVAKAAHDLAQTRIWNVYGQKYEIRYSLRCWLRPKLDANPYILK